MNKKTVAVLVKNEAVLVCLSKIFLVFYHTYILHLPPWVISLAGSPLVSPPGPIRSVPFLLSPPYSICCCQAVPFTWLWNSIPAAHDWILAGEMNSHVTNRIIPTTQEALYNH